MKNLIAFLAFVMLSQAQAQVPGQVQIVNPQAAPIVAQSAQQPKKTLIYDERTNQLVEVTPQVQAQATAPAQAQAESTNASPIYILNSQKFSGYQGASQGAVQEAPTTVVQESPVKVSVSDSIRKERQGAETATEDGIVITLEKARMEDEIRRRERFNSALVPAAQAPIQIQAAQTTATQVVVAPQAQSVNAINSASTEQTEVVEVIPQRPSKRKKVILEDATDDRDYKSEVRAAISDYHVAPINLTQYYVSGLVGTQTYNDAANIRSRLATGFSFGMVTPDRMVVEGSFVYGQSEVDDIAGPQASYRTLNLDQYNFSVAAKYQLLPGKLRPTAGVIGSYTHRNYSFAGYGYDNNSNTILTTDALDAGLEAGLDLALTNSFSIGADFRYLWNIATKNGNRSSQYYQGAYGQRQKYVEDFSYYIATLSAKFTF